MFIFIGKKARKKRGGKGAKSQTAVGKGKGKELKKKGVTRIAYRGKRGKRDLGNQEDSGASMWGKGHRKAIVGQVGTYVHPRKAV